MRMSSMTCEFQVYFNGFAAPYYEIFIIFIGLCGPFQFFCEFEGRCIDEDLRCDGIPDCLQLNSERAFIATDELNCPNQGSFVTGRKIGEGGWEEGWVW